jgi:hypothetical protein
MVAFMISEQSGLTLGLMPPLKMLGISAVAPDLLGCDGWRAQTSWARDGVF